MIGEGWEPGDRLPVPLPGWASGFAYEDYTAPNAALPTRDGRIMGNAVNCGAVISLNPQPTFLVCTDAGNTMKMTENEMRERFHPPEYIMKDLLPSHKEAIR